MKHVIVERCISQLSPYRAICDKKIPSREYTIYHIHALSRIYSTNLATVWDYTRGLSQRLYVPLELHNQLFSEETFVEWAFNTQIALPSNTGVEALISAFCLFPWFTAIVSINTQFWQASSICIGRWWTWVWSIFTCLLCRCIWQNCRSSGTMYNISRMLSSAQVGCTSISQVVQLLESKWLFVEFFINATLVRHHKW